MKRFLLPILAVVVTALGWSVAFAAKDVPYSVAKVRWQPVLGNHRAVVRVEQKADAVWASLPWRRRDASPEQKDVIVVDSATGKEIKNRLIVQISREQGDVVFQPATLPGDYYVYYLPLSDDPLKNLRSTPYARPRATAERAWLRRNELTPERLRDGRWQSLPKAKVVEFQAWSEFHRFDPMEVIATAAETKQLIEKHAGRAYLIFPEDRRYPIRMSDDLPLRWIRRGPSNEFRGEACRGEFYVFQVGVFAASQAVAGLTVDIGDLRSDRGVTIPAAAFHAFNFGGADWLGRPIKRSIDVPHGEVAALWFGVDVPIDTAPGLYQGTLTFHGKGVESRPLRLALNVLPQTLPDGGVSDLWRQARLKWLDSTIGLDDEVVAPYTPMSTSDQTARCLGRSVTFAPSGLPHSIISGRREILVAPMVMIVETDQGPVAWTGGRATVRQTAPGAVWCESRSSGGPLAMTCQAKMEFDGYINYRIMLTAERSARLKDIRLEIPLRRDVATYMMGMARKGGYRPKQWKWIWDRQRANNAIWLGDVDAGLQCKLKGPQDVWGCGGLSKGVPQSWDNNGRGGATVSEEGEAVLLRAFSGQRTIKAGERIEFRFGLLITPVKPLDPDHWSQRYFHYYRDVVPVDTIAKSGANIINCHQGNPLNPNIDYPFLHPESMAAYIAQAHAKGLKVKIYYTVRELSNYAAEIWALRSLGLEVYPDGPGGGYSWLREHLVSHYCPAWHDPLSNGEVDAAIGTTGLSRWHNYYLEGLSYLIKHVGIDGLYLDGIGYDREIMKRVRKVLDRARPGCLIDVHEGDTFTGDNIKCSPANNDMEHFPYVNSIWFGEGFDYNASPDYWLVEMSGIPFGLFGEMLEGGGNPWRGMVYGMTNRLNWCGDPRPIWKLWDDFGIRHSRMIGYWVKNCPVRSGRNEVLATCYVREGKTLVALASWSKGQVDCLLAIDWQTLGLDPARACLRAPAIAGFQPPALFRPTEKIPVYPGRGWLLVIEHAKGDTGALAPRDAYENRPLLVDDHFDRAVLGDPWQTSLSSQPKTAIRLAEQAIVLEAQVNGCVFAERPLPAGSAIVQCLVQAGPNSGGSWGPGLALVWRDKILRVNLRGNHYGIDDGVNQWFTEMIAPTAWQHLRFRLEPQTVFIEGSWDGEFWFPIHAVSRQAFPGDPVGIRLGKMSPQGTCKDLSPLGPFGASRIKQLQVYGDNSTGNKQ